MKKINGYYFLFVILLCFSAQTTLAQTKLYVPRNILKAYEKGTRSFDGKPGKNYWVNSSDYKITAEIFPDTRTLKGKETITYYNNSPDSLNSFVFRLYHDNMKKGSGRNFAVHPSDVTEGIKLDTIIINGVGVNFKSKDYTVRRSSTNLFITKFPHKIAPGSSAKIEIEWQQPPIPKETRIRMGAYTDSTFFFAYWYPQISVYDDIDGWDEQEYGGQVEFYNDIGNFDVELTAPGDFLIWATGLIQNLKEIIQPKILERYVQAQTSDSTVKIVEQEDYNNKSVFIEKEKHTWHFKAENVPDFTFGMAKNYLWNGTSTVVDSKTGRRVFTDAVNPPGRKFDEETPSIAQLSLKYFSYEWPGIPFPYPKITIFNGEQNWGGGMESPMMCNDGTYHTRGGHVGVTVHEMSHTYFPFYMGINERKYAWMDEGWAVFLTFDLVKRLTPEEDEMPGTIKALNRHLGNEYMMPLVSLSHSVTTSGTGVMFYQQPGIAYLILKDFLGEDMFKKCLHEYMNNWNGKHPIPYDFFFTFDNVSGQDLSWFWNPWFFERGFPDLSVKGINEGNNIVIEKIGSYPVPIDLKIIYSDGSEEIIHRIASVWKNGNSEHNINVGGNKEIKKVEILTLLGPDVNPKNNVYEIK